jgi:hypothetical protein
MMVYCVEGEDEDEDCRRWKRNKKTQGLGEGRGPTKGGKMTKTKGQGMIGLAPIMDMGGGR